MSEANLSERQIRFITLGGAVGSGLFFGSGVALHEAGPALLLAYLVGGITVFLVCPAMGELVLARPGLGAFSDFATEFIGRWAGFVTAWSYWLIWMIVGIAETTAAGMFVQYWFPDVPQWLTAGVSVLILGGINLAPIRVFGELEFWLAGVKVFTIAGLIVIGLYILVFGHSGTDASGVANLWRDGGFLPNGMTGLIMAILMAIFAFGGERDDRPDRKWPLSASPRRSKRCQRSALAHTVFYLGSFGIILMLLPWRSLDPSQSPFVMIFARIDFAGASSFINAVILATVISSCNSGIFAASRMLRAAAVADNAPHGLAITNKFGTPVGAVLLSTSALFTGVVLNHIAPHDAFTIATSILAVLTIWVWGIILVSHLVYRISLRRSSLPVGQFPLPGGVATDVLCIGILASAVVLLTLTGRMHFAIIAGLSWFSFIGILYLLFGRKAHGAARPVPSRYISQNALSCVSDESSVRR